MESKLKGYEGKTATLTRFVPLQLTDNGIMVHNLPEVCSAELIEQGHCEAPTTVQEEDDIPVGTAAAPGLAMGPGGRPSIRQVL